MAYLIDIIDTTNTPDTLGIDTMTQPELIQFLNERPAINWAKFAKECGISQALFHYIATNQRNLQPHHVEPITTVAKRYGWGEIAEDGGNN